MSQIALDHKTIQWMVTVIENEMSNLEADDCTKDEKELMLLRLKSKLQEVLLSGTTANK